MKNIIKSVAYELKKTKAIRVTFIVGLLFMLLEGLLNIDTTSSNMAHNASQLVADISVSNIMVLIFIAAVLVGYMCCGDFRDKVVNYEIMSGHSRAQVFISRFIPAVLVSAFLVTVLQFSVMLPGIIMYGWGNAISLGDVIIRNMLIFFPIMRICAFLVIISFIVKSQYLMMAVGYGVFTFLGFIQQLEIDRLNFVTGFSNINLLCDYSGWSTYNLDPVDGIVKYISYNSSVTSGMIIWTIVVSLLVTAFYMFVGYSLFRRDELN